ncbi:hypothetical protein AAFF39_09010 [Lactococcus garvieae]
MNFHERMMALVGEKQGLFSVLVNPSKSKSLKRIKLPVILTLNISRAILMWSKVT